MAESLLTAGQVAIRLGIKSGMVRRYALTLEEVTGLSLTTDPVRGRLYPPPVVELLEATRAYLLNNPGISIDSAMRAVTGQSEGSVTPPARVPGTLTPADLEAALRAIVEPISDELDYQRRENAELRAQVSELLSEVQAVRSQLARLEVTTHAALPAPTPPPTEPQPTIQSKRGMLANLLAIFKS